MTDVGMKWNTLRYARQKGKGEFPKCACTRDVINSKKPANKQDSKRSDGVGTSVQLGE